MDDLGRGERRLVFALFAAGLVLRGAGLLSQSLWSDEALTLVVSGAGDFWGLMRRLESSPPLHFLLMRWWLPLFPDAMAGMRIFSFLCGAASLWAFHRLARRAAPEAASGALFIACLSSFWIHAAQDGRMYGLYLLLAVLQISLLWELRSKDDARLWAGWAALSVLGLYAHYCFLLLILAQAAYVLIGRLRAGRSPLAALAVMALVALLYVPWLGSLAAQARERAGVTLANEPFDAPHVGFIVGTMFADLNFLGLALVPWVSGLGLLMLGALAAGAVAEVRAAGSWRKAMGRWEEAPGFCVAHLAFGLAAFPLIRLFADLRLAQARYFVFLSPFAYLFLARMTAGRDLRRRVGRFGLLTVLLAGVIGYMTSAAVFNPRLDLLARRVKGEAPGVPLVHVHPFWYLPLRYYYFPERTHWLVPGHRKDELDGRSLPGYPALKYVADLPSVGPCLVVDPNRLLGQGPLFSSTGRELAAMMGRSGAWLAGP